MNYRGSYRKLLGNSKAAIVGAIEIYNKPRFEYRDECFVILLVNAWELLLKALLSKNGQSIYYKKTRRQPYRTLSWSDALTRIESRGYWPARAPALLAVRRNLELLTVYRDNAVHYYNEPKFGVLIYSLSQTSIVNYRDVLTAGFGQSLGDEITWHLLPLGLAPPVDPLAYLREASQAPSPRALSEFIKLISDATAELEAAGIDTGRLLTIFSVSLQSTKKISQADVVVGVRGRDGQEAGDTVVVRPLDPNRSHPLFQKNIVDEIGPELNGMKFTSYTFQAIAWQYSLKSDLTYCWIDDDTQRPRWSRNVLTFLRDLAREEIAKALAAYKVRPKPGSLPEAA